MFGSLISPTGFQNAPEAQGAFFLKLQKSFVFLQKTANYTNGRGEIPLQHASIWRHFTGFQAQLSCNHSTSKLLKYLKALQITILVR
jgi:hypothetical protein